MQTARSLHPVTEGYAFGATGPLSRPGEGWGEGDALSGEAAPLTLSLSRSEEGTRAPIGSRAYGPCRERRSIGLSGLAPIALLSGCVPAHAIEPAAGALVLQWGDALATLAQGLTGVIVPIAVAVVTTLTARFAGPLRILITTTLVERLVRNATEYALNAVAGAVRGRALTVPLGSAVIAKAVQRALEQGAPWLVRAAGGRAGIAEKVFRSLSLEDAATVANTLRPALGSGARDRVG